MFVLFQCHHKNLFDEQDVAYKEEVLPAAVTKRLAIEAGTSFGLGQIRWSCR